MGVDHPQRGQSPPSCLVGGGQERVSLLTECVTEKGHENPDGIIPGRLRSEVFKVGVDEETLLTLLTTAACHLMTLVGVWGPIL